MSWSIMLAALAAVLIWGGSPVATKFGLETVPPLTIAVLRTVLGGALAVPILLALRYPLPKTAEQRWLLLISSVCGFVAFPLLYTFGIDRTTAIIGALILALQPLATGTIAAVFDRKRPPITWWLGCCVALAGVTVLILGRDSGTTTGRRGMPLVGEFLLVGALVSACLGYVTGGRLNRLGYPSSAATFWGALIGSLLLLPIAISIDAASHVREASLNSWLGLAYLAVGVTIIAYVMWYWALGNGGIARVAPLQFFQPLSGVILAILILGERVTFSLGLALLLILLGVFLATRAPAR